MKRLLVDRVAMDLNQSAPVEFVLPSTHSPQIQNFMSMSSLTLPYEQTSKEDDGLKNCRLLHLRCCLNQFWSEKKLEIQNAPDIKDLNQLPLARIKRIMKSDENVKMVGADTTILLSKACELLISELTLRAWYEAEEGKRRTIQHCDIARAITQVDSLDFLVKAVPLDNYHEDNEKKCSEGYHQVNHQPFPLLDMNSIPEAQEVKMKTPISGPFYHGPPTKVMRLSESNNGKARKW